ncbi:histone acetyltransferases subunit 3-domain-containing protein, partial [Phakopsora pachyrhizi]
DDFTLNFKSFYPAPPKISSLPPSFPLAQGEVNQDFSKTKTPSSQVPIHQFQNWVNDNYLRSYGEDDLAFLSLEYSSINGCLTRRPRHRPDSNDRVIEETNTPSGEVDFTFEIPALGRHYSEVWREEDIGTVPQSTAEPSPLDGLNLKGDKHSTCHLTLRTCPSDVNESTIMTEKIGVGPLTERLISLIQPLPLEANIHSISAVTGKPISNKSEQALVAPPRLDLYVHQLDSVDLEERVMRELRHIGIMSSDEVVDWSKREDDEISIALRATQNALRNQSHVNSLRKARISEIVRARMAYQEFEQIKDGLDRLIEQ